MSKPDPEPASGPQIVLVYARAANGAIGHEGTLPWHLPADLKRFRQLTMGEDGAGRPMIMGRKTFESLPGILPGRRHIVLTRREDWRGDADGRIDVARSAEQALALAGEGSPPEIMIVGGAAIYDVFRPLADRIEVTEIHREYPGDTFMKPIGPGWALSAREDHPASGEAPAFSFVTYLRADTEAA